MYILKPSILFTVLLCSDPLLIIVFQHVILTIQSARSNERRIHLSIPASRRRGCSRSCDVGGHVMYRSAWGAKGAFAALRGCNEANQGSSEVTSLRGVVTLHPVMVMVMLVVRHCTADAEYLAISLCFSPVLHFHCDVVAIHNLLALSN